MRARILTIAGLLFVLAACKDVARPSVRLSDGQVSNPTDARPGESSLRVAVAAMVSPSATLDAYGPLLEYLAARLDRPVRLVQRTTYAEINDLVRSREIDLAFVCSGAYVEGRRQRVMELLATPVVAGHARYYAYVIVPRDSLAARLTDLRNHVFAFSDPLSNSGHLAVQWDLRRRGYDSEHFFSRTFFTYSHDNSVEAVANHVADGAAVDSLVYDFAVARNPLLAVRVRILARLGPYGMPPVVVRRGLDPDLKLRLLDTLLGLGGDPDAARAREALRLTGFTRSDDAEYDSVRVMAAAIRRWSDER